MKTTIFEALREQLHAEHPECAVGRTERVQELLDRSEQHRHTLAEIRKARAMTQVAVARALEIDQPQVSKLEKRTDAYLSTLESYIQALGGELRLVAVFDGEQYELQLGDLTESSEAAPGREPAAV